MTASTTDVPVSRSSRWPAAVGNELQRRSAAVPRRGRVLELPELAPLDDGFPDPGLPVDTIVCAGVLACVADLPAALLRLRSWLAPDGELFLVEPIGSPGWAPLLVASMQSRAAPIRDLHLDRDVPAALRANGFAITDLERFTMPTRIWSLRRFIAARAVPAPLRAGVGG